MTYVSVTCERCHCQFSWIGQPEPGEPIRCNNCEHELEKLENEMTATAAMLEHWDDREGKPC